MSRTRGRLEWRRLDPRIRRRIVRRCIAGFLCATLAPSKTTDPQTSGSKILSPALIVWNVGQGQWITLSTRHICWHLDMGGERADWRTIEAECAHKRNVVSFSHWDRDHVSFAARAGRVLRGLCITDAPGGSPTPRQALALESLPTCSGLRPKGADELRSEIRAPLRALKAGRAKPGPRPARDTSNGASRIFIIKSARTLAPGDSPRAKEALWAPGLPNPAHVYALILGHHGSRTSTGAVLLNRLSGLRMAIASARSARYGHPHPEIKKAIRSRGIALVQTEIWGHVRLELPPAIEPESETEPD